MKFLTILLSFIALIIIGYNTTKIDFNNPFHGESTVALITILAALCALILLQILRISKNIEAKAKSKRHV